MHTSAFCAPTLSQPSTLHSSKEKSQCDMHRQSASTGLKKGQSCSTIYRGKIALHKDALLLLHEIHTVHSKSGLCCWEQVHVGAEESQKVDAHSDPASDPGQLKRSSETPVKHSFSPAFYLLSGASLPSILLLHSLLLVIPKHFKIL